MNVDKVWGEGSGHGIVNAQSRKYISLCQKAEMLASFYSNTDIIDERTGNDSQILFFNPIDNDSSETGHYSRYSSSNSNTSNFPSSDNPAVFNTLQLTSSSKSPRLSNNNQRLYRPQRSSNRVYAKKKKTLSRYTLVRVWEIFNFCVCDIFHPLILHSQTVKNILCCDELYPPPSRFSKLISQY